MSISNDIKKKVYVCNICAKSLLHSKNNKIVITNVIL